MWEHHLLFSSFSLSRGPSLSLFLVFRNPTPVQRSFFFSTTHISRPQLSANHNFVPKMSGFFSLLIILCSSKIVEAFYSLTRSQNGVQFRQIISVRVWPFSKELDIEYMKLVEAKEARLAKSLQFNQTMALQHLKLDQENQKLNQENQKLNQTMALQHLKLNQENQKLNQTMALQHLKLDQENQKLNQENQKLNQTMALEYLKLNQENQKVILSICFVVLIVFGFSQCAIYIRDGLLGKKSGELAFYTSISIILNQFTQLIKAIWDLGKLKSFKRFIEFLKHCVGCNLLKVKLA